MINWLTRRKADTDRLEKISELRRTVPQVNVARLLAHHDEMQRYCCEVGDYSGAEIHQTAIETIAAILNAVWSDDL